jgi:NAD(P)-dependent dehydrogenase (short-subunit alcohol dehydrogenase family)
MQRILVLGGYGVFGRRAVERLARAPGLEVVVAGRDAAAAAAAAGEIKRTTAARARIDHTAIDATRLGEADLRRLGIAIVLNTIGPFQALDYRVARAAIAARAHYIDIADARGFVCGIGALDPAAQAAGVLVVAGASSVPALAAAVIDHHRGRFQRLTHLTYGISPGNSFDPGVATTASILAGSGQPFTTLIDGRMGNVRGWQPLVRHSFRTPGLGTRWLGHCDVPDLDLFPKRYPDLVEQHFLAGVEVKAFHLALWALSWLVRSGLVRHPDRLASPLLALKRRLRFLGSDRGIMFAEMSGHDSRGRALHLVWELVADKGHGPFIPVTPAVILAKRLAAGAVSRRGAMPAVGLISLGDFSAEVADLAIRHSTWESPTLHRSVLGVAFDRLPLTVQRLHEVAGKSVWAGRAQAERSGSALARIAAWVVGLPAPGQDLPLEVTFASQAGKEE